MYIDNNDSEKNIILCASIYHLFVALMIIYSRKIQGRVYLLLTTHEVGQYEHFKRIYPQLNKLGIPCEIRLRNKKHELLGIEARITKNNIKE